MDDDFFENFHEQSEIHETIQFSTKLYNQYLVITHPTDHNLPINSQSLSDSSSDTSIEDIISRDQFNNIETYRTSMKKPLVRRVAKNN